MKNQAERARIMRIFHCEKHYCLNNNEMDVKSRREVPGMRGNVILSLTAFTERRKI